MGIYILDMALDLIENEHFHVIMDLVEIVNFWRKYELICAC